MGGGLRRAFLRDLDLDVSGAALRDRLPQVEHIVELGAERVRRVRSRADAEERQVLQVGYGDDAGRPGGAIEVIKLQLVDDEGDPAGLRRVEAPDAVLQCGDLAGLAGPRPGRRTGDDIAVALRRRGGRRREILVFYGAVKERVDGEERLVMRDVLLRQREMRYGGHWGSPFSSPRCGERASRRGGEASPKASRPLPAPGEKVSGQSTATVTARSNPRPTATRAGRRATRANSARCRNRRAPAPPGRAPPEPRSRACAGLRRRRECRPRNARRPRRAARRRGPRHRRRGGRGG